MSVINFIRYLGNHLSIITVNYFYRVYQTLNVFKNRICRDEVINFWKKDKSLGKKLKTSEQTAKRKKKSSKKWGPFGGHEVGFPADTRPQPTFKRRLFLRTMPFQIREASEVAGIRGVKRSRVTFKTKQHLSGTYYLQLRQPLYGRLFGGTSA